MTDLEPTEQTAVPEALEPAPPSPKKRGQALRDFARVVSCEAGLFRGRPILWGAVGLVSLIPALYCVIYLSSVWNPLGSLENLPAGVVNLDRAATYQGKEVFLGRDVLADLRRENTFKLRQYPSEAAARSAVTRGEVYFAVVLPADLSQKAVQGQQGQRAQLEAIVSEGTSYTASSIGKRFVEGLADRINVQLNEKRFAGVLGGQQTLESGLSRLRQGARDLLEGAQTLDSGAGKLVGGAQNLSSGLARARRGAGQLADGAETLSGGVSRLTSGVAQLRGGVAQIRQKLPSDADLNRLSSGAQQVTAGARELSGGLKSLSSGAGTLAQKSTTLSSGLGTLSSGAKTLETGALDLSGGLGKLQGGANAVASGSSDLSRALPRLSGGAGSLAQGASELSSGLGKLSGGATSAAQGAQTLSSGLREAQKGGAALAQGAGQVSAGLAQAGKESPALAPLSSGAAQVTQNAQALSGGLDRLSSGALSLAAGTAQLAAGLTPSQTGAQKLSSGASSLSAGLTSAQTGAQKLSAGALQVQKGLTSASSGAQTLASGATRLRGGLGTASSGSVQLAQGARQLASGVQQAQGGAGRLEAGASSLSGGVARLTEGTRQLRSGVDTLASRFPQDPALGQLSSGADTLARRSGELSSGLQSLASGGRQLSSGAQDLSSGAGKLLEGARKLVGSVPADLEGLSGDAQGLAVSVDSREVALQSVPNNGTAFAPYFMALALWVGATTTTFIFHYRLLPSSLSGTGQLGRVLGKAVFPGLLLLVQAALIALSLHFVLDIAVPDWTALLLTLLCGVLAFLGIFVALLTLLGDAGRLIALVLMVFQLGAAGGSYPIELLPEAFQRAHDLLPITDLIKALRAALFGSYGGDWGFYALRLLAVGALALTLALLLGRRWRFTPDYQPAVVI